MKIALPFAKEKIILTVLLTVSHLSPYFGPKTAATLTIGKLTKPFEVVFSEDGSNQRCYEGVIYGALSRYL